MRNTTAKGDITVAMVTAEFLRMGIHVLKPLSDGLRYDLVIDNGGRFLRIQCKTGFIRHGVILFPAFSVAGSGKKPKNYRGSADIFGIYCAATNKCYIIPVDDVGVTYVTLRVDLPKNGQTRGLKYASDFELCGGSSAAERFLAKE